MKKNKKGEVSVVISIDTEGPIKDKRKPEIINTWFKTKKLVNQMTNSKFRMKFKDKNNNGIIYSWFILTLTGFKTNPFRRPMKYNQTYNFYNDNFSKNFMKYNDEIYWHYHQPAKSGVGNDWSRDWNISQEYINILNRLIIDKNFFPSCFRAGGRIEDNDLSNWLENYIPFDYSNCSGKINWNRIESDGKKLKDVADWSKAPISWIGYHPDKNDYQKVGDQKRYMFRCMDLKSPVYDIKDSDIEQAFKTAESGNNAILSVFEHDRRFIALDNIIDFCRRVYEISKKYPKIKWLYKNAKDAALNQKKIKKISPPKFKMKMLKENRIMITTDDNIFGINPYTCVKQGKKYFEINLMKSGLNKWISSPILLKGNIEFFVVANNNSGNSLVQHKKFNI
jgi:hypothetical protein